MKKIVGKSFTDRNGTRGEIRLGVSSWSENDLSAKFAYPNAIGRTSRTAEVPLDVAIAIVAFMKSNIDLLPDDIVRELTKL